jgi:hypothetical protein
MAGKYPVRLGHVAHFVPSSEHFLAVDASEDEVHEKYPALMESGIFSENCHIF